MDKEQLFAQALEEESQTKRRALTMGERCAVKAKALNEYKSSEAVEARKRVQERMQRAFVERNALAEENSSLKAKIEEMERDIRENTFKAENESLKARVAELEKGIQEGGDLVE